MNARERNLLIALIAIVGLGVMMFGGKRWFLDPLKERNAAIAKLTEENEEVEGLLQTFEKERAKLRLGRLKSLPANREQASAEYIAYLHPLLESSGLEKVEVVPSAAQDVKLVTAIPGLKKTGHQVMIFTVRADGELQHLVAALEQLQATPFEHRIKSLTVNRADMTPGQSPRAKLHITMIAETLLVANTKAKPGDLPGVDPLAVVGDALVSPHGFSPILLASLTQLKQAMRTPVDRDYDDIARKNIFVGALPPPPIVKVEPPKKEVEVVEVETPEVEPAVNVPAYVRLVHTVPDQQMAYLRNFVYSRPEMKLDAKERSGYDTFRIIDDDTGHIFFKAKVLRIELRAVYFQVKDDVYKLQIGQTLADAMASPLSGARIDLEDEGLYDRAWAAEEKGADKKKDSTKKKGSSKGGR